MRRFVSNGMRRSIRLCLILVTLFAAMAVNPVVALANDAGPKPSVLVVDSNLGDAELCMLHWLGNDTEIVKEDGAKSLVTTRVPTWWSEDGAPSTFVLSCDSAPIGSDEVVWALDAIKESGANPKTFVVAMGATGLPVRAYAQDLASTKQSSRADVVGIAFLGTPNNGFVASATYPECGIWNRIAGSIGVSSSELLPNSGYLEFLNNGKLPNVLKSIGIAGTVGDLGFGPMDGAGTPTDLALSPEVASQVEHTQANATISRAINLTGSWQPFTSAIDYPDRVVDQKLVEQLSAMECYETSGDAQEAVRKFYQSWFAGNDVITHASYVMLLDLSGSMNETVAGATSKLDAARQAAKEYLHAMSACEKLPLSAPIDVAGMGFSESVLELTSGYDDSAMHAIESVKASGETDIGQALDAAIEGLKKTPVCATRRVLLLSDGASTQGQSEDQIMAGAVSQAKELGVAIDTIGFGDTGESNESFLKRVSEVTGGEYHSATDTYSLRIGFLKSYYSSLGSELVDEELNKEQAPKTLIQADGQTQALELGIVFGNGTAPIQLLCNGEPVDASHYVLSEQESMVSLRYLSPPQGEYAISLGEASAPVHVFAVRQQGVSSSAVTPANQVDHSLLLVGIASAVLLVAVIAVVVFTKRKTTASTVEEGNLS